MEVGERGMLRDGHTASQTQRQTHRHTDTQTQTHTDTHIVASLLEQPSVFVLPVCRTNTH
eukprot:3453720-Rhodomonas_salina.2